MIMFAKRVIMSSLVDIALYDYYINVQQSVGIVNHPIVLNTFSQLCIYINNIE